MYIQCSNTSKLMQKHDMRHSNSHSSNRRVRVTARVRTGSCRARVERKCFWLRNLLAAAEDDAEDVAVEKAESRGQHSTEVSDGQQGQRNSDDSVEYRHHHPRSGLRRYVPVTCRINT